MHPSHSEVKSFMSLEANNNLSCPTIFFKQDAKYYWQSPTFPGELEVSGRFSNILRRSRIFVQGFCNSWKDSVDLQRRERGSGWRGFGFLMFVGGFG